MAATVLHSMAGQPEAGQTTPFTDVAADQWYADAVQWAAANGIMTGYAGAFRPDQPITREQLAAILYRYAQQQGYDTTAGADLSGFADASEISDYAVAAMQWAHAEGLINGMTHILPRDMHFPSSDHPWRYRAPHHTPLKISENTPLRQTPCNCTQKSSSSFPPLLLLLC